jgi:glycosyltransferase involved in cell wall biosynthesis
MVPQLMRAAGASVNLLMLSHYFAEHRGGIEIVAEALARELARLGFSVSWLATGELNAAADDSHIGKYALSASNIGETLFKVPYPILLPSAWRKIFGEARRAEVIIAHDALYMTSIFGYLAARALRKPFVIVQHIGLVPYQNPVLLRLMELANRLVAAPLLVRASKVVFISQLTMSYFAKLRWVNDPTLIFNGVDVNLFYPAIGDGEIRRERQVLNLPADATIISFVGRFVEKKGLRILEHLARNHPEFIFAFAGWGSLDPTLWGLKNVRVFKSLSGRALAGFYRASDLFLLPSVGEGFPLVVQEALACGLPVICGLDTAQADSNASPFLKGVKVDLDNSDETAASFSREIVYALGQPEVDSDRLRRFEFARTNYSWTSAAASYASLLGSLAVHEAHPNEGHQKLAS